MQRNTKYGGTLLNNMDNNVLQKEIEYLKEEIQSIKQINGDVRELAVQVKELAIEMRHMRETQEEHSKRIQTLEDKPAKRYDNIVNYIITSIIALVIGFIAATLGLKK